MNPSEKVSYLVPRDPSIKCWEDRVKLPAPMFQNVVKLGLDDADEESKLKLKVYLRIKPYEGHLNMYKAINNTLEVEPPKDRKISKNMTTLIHKFRFTSIFKSDSTQEQIFEKCVLNSLKRFINGINDLLFAYGTTNAGKTYTMQGTVQSPGIIPRGIRFVFNSLKHNMETYCEFQPFRHSELRHLDFEEQRREAAHKNFILNLDLSKWRRQADITFKSFRSETTNFTGLSADDYENTTFREMESNLSFIEYEVGGEPHALWISMIEIYNEQIYDLLEVTEDKDGRSRLSFAEDESGKVYIKGLKYVNVVTGHEAFQVFQFGKKNLRFSSTALNEHSSRSHCICTLTLAKFLNSGQSAILSRFSFCDLAGAERVKKAHTNGHRMAESKSINTSLSIFSKCLTVIKENQAMGLKKIVPYRESKLTRMFRDAMMGKESFSIIVNITPEAKLFDETLNVLKFSAIAQQIVPVNLFAKPKPIKPIGRSRFTAVVSNVTDSSKIDWETTSIKKDNEDLFERITEVIDDLRRELEEEKKRAESIEARVREEMTEDFAKVMQEYIEKNRVIYEKDAQRMHEIYRQKEKRLIAYFEEEKRMGKRRRRDEDCSESEDSDSEEIVRDTQCLKSENTSLRGLIQQMTTETKKLQERCTEMGFNLAEKERLLKMYQEERNGESEGENKLVTDLEEQIMQLKSKVKELKELLDESAFEYRDLLETNKTLKNEVEGLTGKLASASSANDHLRWELNDYQAMLSERTDRVEQLEMKIDKMTAEMHELREILKRNENEKDEALRELEKCLTRVNELTNYLDEARAEGECLRIEVESLRERKPLIVNYDHCGDKVDALRTKNEELEAKHSEQETEIQTLQNEIKSLTAQMTSINTQTENEEDERRRIDDLQRLLQEERDSHEETRRENKKMAEELQEIERKETNSESQINLLQERVQSLENEVQMYKKDIGALIEERQQLEDEIKQLRDSNDALTNPKLMNIFPDGEDTRLLEDVCQMGMSALSLSQSESKKSRREDLSTGCGHPAIVKSCQKGLTGRKTERKTKFKANERTQFAKTLFQDNDYDEMDFLQGSFSEPELPRLRPRKK